MKTGAVATVTHVGTPDFIGDPYPIYYTTVWNGEAISWHVMSDELKPHLTDAAIRDTD